MCSNQELPDMHFKYGLADCNVVIVRHLQQQKYPGRRYLYKKTFVSIHRGLCKNGNFELHVANKGWPIFIAPEVEEDIRDVVIETHSLNLLNFYLWSH
jgi:hypothetical protein